MAATVTISDELRTFAKRPAPKSLGVYEPLRGLLFPHRVGSPADLRWLASPQLFMNSVTDRPFLVRQLFHTAIKSDAPLEAVLLLGITKRFPDLRSALCHCATHSRGQGMWVDRRARLAFDPLSPAGHATARWVAERRLKTPAKHERWLSTLVGVRVPGIVAQGHCVAVIADLRERILYFFDPEAQGDGRDSATADFCLAATSIDAIQHMLRGAGLPPSFKWRQRIVLSTRTLVGPQHLQNTASAGAGPNLAGANTCSAWCILFIHLLHLHAGRLDPLQLAQLMVDKSVRPHLRQVIARYGTVISTTKLPPAIARERQVTVRRWKSLDKRAKLTRYRALVPIVGAKKAAPKPAPAVKASPAPRRSRAINYRG